jgi:hypothetical protein
MFFRLKAVGERTTLRIVETRRDGCSGPQHVVATPGREKIGSTPASSTGSCSPAPA